MNFLLRQSGLRDLHEKVVAGVRISEEEALRLFRTHDLNALGSIADLVRPGTGRDALDVPFATFFGSTRLRRLSPLVQPANGDETLIALQTANAGILLSPGEARSGYGS